jgi:hypothetical protein
MNSQKQYFINFSVVLFLRTSKSGSGLTGFLISQKTLKEDKR